MSIADRPWATNQDPGDLPVLRSRDGATWPLPVHQWAADATVLEKEILDRIEGPVLDLGCGPGRLVAALSEQGVTALGVDTSPQAIVMARQRGAAVLERSVFDPLPGSGRWRTVLLLDGNVGIGGDPPRLLQRCAELLAPGGTSLIEVDPPGCSTEIREVRLEAGREISEWFPWALVGVEGLTSVAAEGGHDVTEMWSTSGRWFARLTPSTARR